MVSAQLRPCFSASQLKVVRAASKTAATLVTDYYRIAPREWLEMPYEIRTLRSLDSAEVMDEVLAQTLCYKYRREAGSLLIRQGHLYRICLQDHCILDVARKRDAGLGELLTYVLTHELVHVVRFGCRLQSLSVPEELRRQEEETVEKTTWAILARTGQPGIIRLMSELH